MAPGPSLSSAWTQFFPPKPKFTEDNVSDLKGKVYIVTGANSGAGKELARILFTKNAKVYVAARSADKANEAITDIQKSAPSSKGKLVYLYLDLSDLEKTKAAAHDVLKQETSLHGLYNNAGVMPSPQDPFEKTVQGHELALGVNCIATYLFTKLLTPLLAATARVESPNTVRVVWLASFGLELFAVEDKVIDMTNLDYHKPVPAMDRYGISKVGDWALAAEYARRHLSEGIVSVAINPGNLNSGLARGQSRLTQMAIRPLTYPTIQGARTELFACFSPEITAEKMAKGETWVIPFGRVVPLRRDLPKTTRPESEGGTGANAKFLEWVEQQIKSYL